MLVRINGGFNNANHPRSSHRNGCGYALKAHYRETNRKHTILTNLRLEKYYETTKGVAPVREGTRRFVPTEKIAVTSQLEVSYEYVYTKGI